MIEAKEAPHQLTLHHLNDVVQIVGNRFMSYEWKEKDRMINLHVRPEVAWDLMKLLRSQGYRVKCRVESRFRKPAMVLSTSLNGRSGKSVAYARRAAELAAQFEVDSPQVLFKKRSVELSFCGDEDLECIMARMVDALDELGHARMLKEAYQGTLGREFVYTIICD